MGEKEGTKCFAPLRPTKRGAQFRATKAFVTPQRWKRVYGMNARTRTPYARSKKKKKAWAKCHKSRGSLSKREFVIHLPLSVVCSAACRHRACQPGFFDK